jgi:hypothetical protein
MTGKKRTTARNSKAIGSDLKKVDAYVLGSKDYEEIPELTEEWFRSADMYVGGKLVPAWPATLTCSQATGQPAARFRRAGTFPPPRPRLAGSNQCGAAQGGEAAGEDKKTSMTTISRIRRRLLPNPHPG